VARAGERGDSLDADGGGSGAVDARAHGCEERGEVDDFRFAGAVLKEGFAVGEDGGHEEVFSAGDGDLIKHNMRAAETVGPGLDVAVLGGDFRAHLLKAFEVEVDGAATDGASAGHGDASEAGAGDEGAEDQRRGAHGLDDFILGDGVREVGATNARASGVAVVP